MLTREDKQKNITIRKIIIIEGTKIGQYKFEKTSLKRVNFSKLPPKEVDLLCINISDKDKEIGDFRSVILMLLKLLKMNFISLVTSMVRLHNNKFIFNKMFLNDAWFI